MLGARSYKIIEFYIKICGLMGSIPYDWDKEKCVVICNQTLRRKMTFGFGVIHSIFYLGFLLRRLVILVGRDNPSYFAIVWLWNWVNMIIWSLVTFYNAHNKKEEVVPLFRGLKKLVATLKAEHPRARLKNSLGTLNTIDIHFFAIIWIWFLYNASVSFMFYVVPHRPEYIFSVISARSDEIHPIIYKFLFGAFLAFEIYSKSSQTCMMAFDFFTLNPILSLAAFWLRFSRTERISMGKKIQNFQRLQILNAYFNHAFVWLLTPVLFFWIPGSLIIAGTFAAIRLHPFLTFFEYIPLPINVNNCVVLLTVAMVPATAIYDESTKLYKEIKSGGGNGGIIKNKGFRKRVASLKPFGVGVGPVVAVKRAAILVSYYFIANNVFTLLITFPQDQVTP